MLAFTLRMIIADIQKTFRGFFIIPYIIFFGFITVVPFFDNEFLIVYMIMLLFVALVPQITKIFYVLPLGRKLLRRYIHLRVIVLSSLFLLEGSLMTLISLKWTIPNIKGGWLMIMFYVMLIIFISIFNIDAAYKNKIKNNIALVVVVVFTLGNFINAMFFTNFKMQLFISIISIIIAEALLIMLIGKAELINYVEPVYYGFLKGKQKVEVRDEHSDI